MPQVDDLSFFRVFFFFSVFAYGGESAVNWIVVAQGQWNEQCEMEIISFRIFFFIYSKAYLNYLHVNDTK